MAPCRILYPSQLLFVAFGRTHRLVAGTSHSLQRAFFKEDSIPLSHGARHVGDAVTRRLESSIRRAGDLPCARVERPISPIAWRDSKISAPAQDFGCSRQAPYIAMHSRDIVSDYWA